MLPENLRELPDAAALEAHESAAIVDGRFEHGELTLWIDPAQIAAICRFLKNERQFIRLSSVTAVDWYPLQPRFEVVYHLHSPGRNARLRLKCRLGGEAPEIESVTGVWRSADWYEREVFDLFGVRFLNHPGLRRILLAENWEGHPLRKDFPVDGHKYDYRDSPAET